MQTRFFSVLLLVLSVLAVAPRAASPVLVLVAEGCNVPAKTIVNDFSPAGQCLFSAALSGKIDFTQPATAVLQLLAICTGATVQDAITLFEQLTGTDAGIGSGPGAPTPAQIVAMYVEAKKLPVTFSSEDAKKALGAKK